MKPALKWDAVATAVAAAQPAAGPLSADNLELVLDRDAKVDDGRFANNGWLQEVPDPVTKLTWDNAAIFSPETARALGVTTGDLVRLDLAGRTLEIAALVAARPGGLLGRGAAGLRPDGSRARRPGRGLQRLRASARPPRPTSPSA